MGNIVYEASIQSANVGGASAPLAAFITGANLRASIREIGWVQTGASTGAVLNLETVGNPTSVVATTSVLGNPEDPAYGGVASSVSVLSTAWSTAPTAGSSLYRRYTVNAADEVGLVWTWQNGSGLIVPVSSGIVLFSNSGTLNSLGWVWIVWEE